MDKIRNSGRLNSEWNDAAKQLPKTWNKSPQLTFGFWIIKILATTLGETGGDAVSMSLSLGYAVSSLIFMALFVLTVIVQIMASRFHPILYWLVIVATTTAGTTIADLADRSFAIGYSGGAAALCLLLVASLWIWKSVLGSVSVNTGFTVTSEAFYWVTILISQTLGTALGDWVADTNGLGYENGVFIFSALLGLIAATYFSTSVSRNLLFWAAFIFTRPLGATLGDLIDKPVDEGGLNISRIYASILLMAVMCACIFLIPQRSENRAHLNISAP